MAGRLLSLNGAAVTAAAQARLLAVAEGIAVEVAPHYRTVEAGVDSDGVFVSTHGSFDHLKEWGSVNNAPSGYMRAAAARHGRFRPE